MVHPEEIVKSRTKQSGIDITVYDYFTILVEFTKTADIAPLFVQHCHGYIRDGLQMEEDPFHSTDSVQNCSISGTLVMCTPWCCTKPLPSARYSNTRQVIKYHRIYCILISIQFFIQSNLVVQDVYKLSTDKIMTTELNSQYTHL